MRHYERYLSNSYAADMIPMRLIISITVISVLTTFLVSGFYNVHKEFDENQLQNECSILQSKLFTMVQSGICRETDNLFFMEGTKRMYTLNLPSSLSYFAFGVDPDPDNDGVLTTGLTCDGSVIVYKIDGGTKKTFWLPEEIRFREGKYDNGRWIMNEAEQGFIVLDAGITTIIFELIETYGKTCVLIHGNDGINLEKTP